MAAVTSLCRLRTTKELHCGLPPRGGERSLAFGADGRECACNLTLWQSSAHADQPRGKLNLDALARRCALPVHLVGNRAEDLAKLDILGF